MLHPATNLGGFRRHAPNQGAAAADAAADEEDPNGSKVKQLLKPILYFNDFSAVLCWPVSHATFYRARGDTGSAQAGHVITMVDCV
jgi:hypothetical protein